MDEHDPKRDEERQGLVIGPTENASDVQVTGHVSGAVPGRSDETIRARIEDRIRASSLADSRIDVEVRTATVVLRGEVSGPSARHMAEQIAESVGGVRAVTNELTVRPE